ncbi:hypothetical protein AVEN_90508-1 [Araneus ventricosus]|uniref:Uncharacterized protein n=1 Tax=Araneus ventricosus TaxID=182803 RepID=A0A4Y2RVJ1_ARAVE|nr:hypothetical protein AVEN_90508-1 [Araneus ventricosus]
MEKIFAPARQSKASSMRGRIDVFLGRFCSVFYNRHSAIPAFFFHKHDWRRLAVSDVYYDFFQASVVLHFQSHVSMADVRCQCTSEDFLQYRGLTSCTGRLYLKTCPGRHVMCCQRHICCPVLLRSVCLEQHNLQLRLGGDLTETETEVVLRRGIELRCLRHESGARVSTNLFSDHRC